MAKVGADIIYQGSWLTIRAMARPNGRMPAKEWADGLDERGQGKLLAAATIIENSFQRNRPPAGRIDRVSKELWELKVTPPSGSAPHLRMLYVRRGQTLWAATGFTKQKNALESKDIKLADGIAKEWAKGKRKT